MSNLRGGDLSLGQVALVARGELRTDCDTSKLPMVSSRRQLCPSHHLVVCCPTHVLGFVFWFDLFAATRSRSRSARWSYSARSVGGTENILEIGPGKGANSITFDTPNSN